MVNQHSSCWIDTNKQPYVANEGIRAQEMHSAHAQTTCMLQRVRIVLHIAARVVMWTENSRWVKPNTVASTGLADDGCIQWCAGVRLHVGTAVRVC